VIKTAVCSGLLFSSLFFYAGGILARQEFVGIGQNHKSRHAMLRAMKWALFHWLAVEHSLGFGAR